MPTKIAKQQQEAGNAFTLLTLRQRMITLSPKLNNQQVIMIDSASLEAHATEIVTLSSGRVVLLGRVVHDDRMTLLTSSDWRELGELFK